MSTTQKKRWKIDPATLALAKSLLAARQAEQERLRAEFEKSQEAKPK